MKPEYDYNTSLGIKFSIKRQQGRNTSNEITEFLIKNDRLVIKRVYNDVNKDLILEFIEQEKVFLLYDITENNSTSDYNEMIKLYNKYNGKNMCIAVINTPSIQELELLDFDLIRRLNIKTISEDFTHTRLIRSLCKSVSNDRHNQALSEIVINKELNELLSLPDASLILKGAVHTF